MLCSAQVQIENNDSITSILIKASRDCVLRIASVQRKLATFFLGSQIKHPYSSSVTAIERRRRRSRNLTAGWPNYPAQGLLQVGKIHLPEVVVGQHDFHPAAAAAVAAAAGVAGAPPGASARHTDRGCRVAPTRPGIARRASSSRQTRRRRPPRGTRPAARRRSSLLAQCRRRAPLPQCDDREPTVSAHQWCDVQEDGSAYLNRVFVFPGHSLAAPATIELVTCPTDVPRTVVFKRCPAQSVLRVLRARAFESLGTVQLVDSAALRFIDC